MWPPHINYIVSTSHFSCSPLWGQNPFLGVHRRTAVFTDAQLVKMGHVFVRICRSIRLKVCLLPACAETFLPHKIPTRASYVVQTFTRCPLRCMKTERSTRNVLSLSLCSRQVWTVPLTASHLPRNPTTDACAKVVYLVCSSRVQNPVHTSIDPAPSAPTCINTFMVHPSPVPHPFAAGMPWHVFFVEAPLHNIWQKKRFP